MTFGAPFKLPVGVSWAVGGNQLVFVEMETDSETSINNMIVTIDNVGELGITESGQEFDDFKPDPPSVTYGLINPPMAKRLYAWVYGPIVTPGHGIEGSLPSSVVDNLVVINWGLIKSKFNPPKLNFTVKTTATIHDHPETSFTGGYGVSDISSWGTFAAGDGTSQSSDLWFTSGAQNTNVQSTSAVFVFSGSATLDGALALAAGYEAANPGRQAVVSAPTTGVEPYVPTTTHRYERFNYTVKATGYVKSKIASVAPDLNFTVDVNAATSLNAGDGNDHGPQLSLSYSNAFTFAADLSSGNVT